MKILIAPVGNGIRKSEEENAGSTYEITNYRFEKEERNYQTSLIFEAILQHQLDMQEEVDEVLLVGTVHSCWKDIYSYCLEKREDRKNGSVTDKERNFPEQIEAEEEKVDRNSSIKQI